MDHGHLDPRKVRAQREALGLTQKQAAARIPVNVKTVQAWESVENAPARVYLHVLQAFATAYGCSVVDLLTVPKDQDVTAEALA